MNFESSRHKLSGDMTLTGQFTILSSNLSIGMSMVGVVLGLHVFYCPPTELMASLAPFIFTIRCHTDHGDLRPLHFGTDFNFSYVGFRSGVLSIQVTGPSQ